MGLLDPCVAGLLWEQHKVLCVSAHYRGWWTATLLGDIHAAWFNLWIKLACQVWDPVHHRCKYYSFLGGAEVMVTLIVHCEWPLQSAVHTVKSFMQILVGVSALLLTMNTEWGFWFYQMCSVRCHVMLCGNWTNASIHNKIVEGFDWKFDSDLWCDKSVLPKEYRPCIAYDCCSPGASGAKGAKGAGHVRR